MGGETSPQNRTNDGATPAPATAGAAPAATRSPGVQAVSGLGYTAGAASLSPRSLGLGSGGAGGIASLDYATFERMQATRRAPLRRWMDGNTSRLLLHSRGYIIAHVRANVPEAAGMGDGDIEIAANEWAAAHGTQIPAVSGLEPNGPPTSVEPSESVLIARVKSAFQGAVDGVTLTRGNGNINLSVKGATATLNSGGTEVSAGVSPTGGGSVGVKRGETEVKATASFSGTLGLEASRGPVHFSGSIGAEGWEMSLSFGSTAVTPMLGQLAGIFGRSETAFRGIVGEAVRGGNITTLGGRVQPFLAPVGEAVKAAQAIAATSESRVSAGVSVSGGGADGVRALATLTIRF